MVRHRRVRRIHTRARRSYRKMGGWKPIVTKLSVGIGAAMLTTIVLQKAGINVPYIKYVPAYMLGGPVGIAGALGLDMLQGNLAIPGLGSVTGGGGPVV